MPRSAGIRIEGLKDLDKSLDNLSKSVGRGVLRRSLKKAAEPMRAKAADLAPKKTRELSESIKIASTLDKKERRRHRQLKNRTAIELFMGPSYKLGEGGRHGHLAEFGTEPHENGGLYAGTRHPGTAPQPFMRPAFDEEARPTIERLKPILWDEIEKAAARAERKAARLQQR